MQKENPTISIDNLDLSANYIDFYDKFEKINVVYNALIEEENITLSTINELVNRYVGIYGTFHFCRELVKKYGFVPTQAMPEANEKYNAFLNLELLKAKIKTDATSLIGKSKEEKQEEKEKLMQEAYNFLSKTMGNPPTKFIFQNEEYTPLTFKEKYLSSNLEDFITITFYDKNTFLESFSFIPNIYLNKKENIKVMNPQKIKEAVRKQLEDGIAVWFSAEESTTINYEQNILDTNTCKYKELLNIKDLPKKQQLLLDIVNYDHAMCITGAFIVDNEIKQWKVDNSFGKHGAYQGHLIMTNDFFEKKVITFIIDKKYFT